MNFNSFSFLIFLPIVFLIYQGLNRKLQNILLMVASQIFYGWWDWRFLILLWISTFLDYFVGLLLERTHDKGKRRGLIWVSLVGNLGMLATFKYYDFFVQSAMALGERLGLPFNLTSLKFILPVGISFYTFQTLSYTLDVYKGQMKACRNPVEFLVFVSYFPQLVAGPIEKARDLLPQFQKDRQLSLGQFADGARLILWGFFKKMVVADNLAPLVESAFDAPNPGGGWMMVGSLAFIFQIYGDFSGYSDIARGVSRMFGIELTANFRMPFLSRNMDEFWQRWHITLTSWFREYVYFPLGGNRRGWWRTAVNVVATFTLSGLWHGANWTFVIWGLLNGLLFLPSMLERKARKQRENLRRPGVLIRMLETLVTLLLFAMTMVFFRSHSLEHALVCFGRMLEFALHPAFSWNPLLGPLLAYVLVMMAAEILQGRRDHPLAITHLPLPWRWTLEYGLLMICLIWGQFNSNTTFIYFQF